MPVYELKASKPVSFTDETGVSFLKNPVYGKTKFLFAGDGYISIPYIPAYNENGAAGGRIEITIQLNTLEASNHFFFDDAAQNFRILHNGVNNEFRSVNFNSGVFGNGGAPDLNEHVFAMTWSTDLDGAFYDDGVLVASLQSTDVLTLPLLIGNNVPLTAGMKGFIRDVKFYDSKLLGQGSLTHHWPINEGTGTVINDIVGGSSFNGTLTPGSGSWQAGTTFDEQATLVSIIANTVSPANTLQFNMTWGTDPVVGDIVDMVYDGTGNLIDESPLPDNPAIPLLAQTIRSVNCLDPTEGVNLFNALSGGSSIINLSWIEPVDVSNLIAYKLYRNGVYVQDVALGQTSFTDQVLNPSTTYTYRLDTLLFNGNVIDASSDSASTTSVPVNILPVSASLSTRFFTSFDLQQTLEAPLNRANPEFNKVRFN